jgi:hypothetical protein
LANMTSGVKSAGDCAVDDNKLKPRV